MKISATSDYAVRAAAELAAAEPGRPVKAEALANAQGIPVNFLENILASLRNAGIVRSQRGAEGGYLLARDPAAVSLADVIRAVDGPLAAVRGEAPEDRRISTWPQRDLALTHNLGGYPGEMVSFISILGSSLG